MVQRRSGVVAEISDPDPDVDLQGRLTNLPYNFGRAVGRLPAMLARSVRRHEASPTRQRQRRLTPVEVDELVQARRDGRTIDTLARQFGVHRTTVMAHLRRVGLPHE